MAFVALCQFLQHARWSTWRKNSLRVRRCESCLQTRWLLAAVVAERALLNNQIYRIMLFRRSFPIQTSRGSKLIRLSSTFHHGWILDSFQMGDATCYSRYSDSQSWFGPGLGEIRNIKWSILIGGSSCSMRGAVCQSICSSLEDSRGGLDVWNGNWIHIPSHYKLQCMPCWRVLLLHFWKESLNIQRCSQADGNVGEQVTDVTAGPIVKLTSCSVKATKDLKNGQRNGSQNGLPFLRYLSSLERFWV